MGFFRILIWALVFYIIFKLISGLFRIFTTPRQNRGTRSEYKKSENKNSKIKKEDIIEAEFEEINEKDNEKEKSKD